MKLIDQLTEIAKSKGYSVHLEQADDSRKRIWGHIYYGTEGGCPYCGILRKHIVVQFKDYKDLLWTLAHEVGHSFVQDMNSKSTVLREYEASKWALYQLKPFIRYINLERGALMLQEWLNTYLECEDAVLADNNLVEVAKNLQGG
jgi:hypothetical protein